MTQTVASIDVGGTGLSTVGTSGYFLQSTGTGLQYAAVPATTPGGSSGYVQYNNGTTFAGSANFFWDNTNIRLGIGTSSPAYKLDVSGSISSTNGVYFYNNGNIAGQNGIALGTAAKNVAGSGSQGVIGIYSNDASNQLQGSVTLVTDATAANRRLAIGVIEQGVSYRNVTIAENGGNVGIGTTSPSGTAKLDVNGQIYSANGTASAPGFASRGENNAGLFFGDNGVASFLGFAAGGSERARIHSNGNLQISSGLPIWNSSGRPMLNQTGGILQVVGFSTSTTTSTSSNSYVSTTLSASITPSSTSSQIIVMAYCPYDVNNGGSSFYESFGALGLFRNSTNLEEEQVGWSLSSNGNNKDCQGAWTPIVVDSPATTSSVNYNVQLKTGSGNFTISLRNTSFYAGAALNNNPRLLLMEVAG